MSAVDNSDQNDTMCDYLSIKIVRMKHSRHMLGR